MGPNLFGIRAQRKGHPHQVCSFLLGTKRPFARALFGRIVKNSVARTFCQLNGGRPAIASDYDSQDYRALPAIFECLVGIFRRQVSGFFINLDTLLRWGTRKLLRRLGTTE